MGILVGTYYRGIGELGWIPSYNLIFIFRIAREYAKRSSYDLPCHAK